MSTLLKIEADLAFEVEIDGVRVTAGRLTGTGQELELRVQNPQAFATGDDAVGIRVQDNGCGGADSERRGLRGLRDRVEAAGGHATISSNAKGTTIRATVPCGS